jgi:serine/threonine protein kinase
LTDNKKLGRYSILKQLGKGSMSTVYQAVDPLLGREVAIKVILPQYYHLPGFIKRFEREAIALARLDHPNIIKIYDMGDENKQFYMVIQLLNGGTLKQRLQINRKQKTTMPLADIGNILGPICNGVDYFHQSGFIHRDLKPANIMFDENDKPYIADFGIVKNLDWESFTSAGSILGTPFYMSPEQLAGKVDVRTDIYSLGIIVYEMATGDVPFRSSNISEVISAHIKQTPTPPHQIVPEIPESVSDVILKSMAKAPSDRYDNAMDMYHALEPALPKKISETIPATMRIKENSSQTSVSTHDAFLKSINSGVRYKLSSESDNRIGRSKQTKKVEVDLSSEKDSEFVHSVHAIIRHSETGWELETFANISNPVYVNKYKITPGEKTPIFHGDELTLSKCRLILETG